MTTNEIALFFYNWINQVLVINGGETNLTIIKSNQNANRPDLPFISIGHPFALQKIGRTGNQSSPDINGDVILDTHYEATITLNEIGGLGDRLKTLLNSLIRPDIIDLFSENNISILRYETITPDIELTQNIYEKRAIVDLFVLFTDRFTYNANYIETVETTGTYTGKKS